MGFELVQKATFTHQLLAIPKEQVVQILKKIEILRDEPQPHGNLKKKLHGYKDNIYRLRCGDYRIIYTYGDGWVSLMGVDARKDVYQGDKLVAEPPLVNVKNLPSLTEILTPTTPTPHSPSSNPLPVIDQELLINLRIPPEYIPILTACRHLDDLIAAPVPNYIRDQVFDCITTPNFDQVSQQPNLKLEQLDDLLRFKDGDLIGFLLKLNPEQEKYVKWAINAQGPTLLKGGPGTGKSTVALYRVKALIEAWKAQNHKSPKILFTTYTNALVTFSQQLLESLLGEDLKYVEVKTVDAIALSLLASPGQLNFAKPQQQRQLVQKARQEILSQLKGTKLERYVQEQILLKLDPDYLLTEINTIIEGRSLTNLQAYLDTPRHGREVSLNKVQRYAIWLLKEKFDQLLEQQNLATWEQVRSRALRSLRERGISPPYDAIIIDEAQDLDPNALRLLIALCRSAKGIFITADANQSIYSSGFRWSDVHEDLKFVGRTGILRTNHRTTQEIDRAAYAYLQQGELESEAITRDYIYSGPAPAVRAVKNRADELALLERFCWMAAREFRLGIDACAILVPTDEVGKTIAEQLHSQKLPATYMRSRELDLKTRGVKVLTLQGAKGLEFPIVAIAGFSDYTYPQLSNPKALAERHQKDRRRLFVAMTRAMRALLVVIPADYSGELLHPFDPQFWNLG